MTRDPLRCVLVAKLDSTWAPGEPVLHGDACSDPPSPPGSTRLRFPSRPIAPWSTCNGLQVDPSTAVTVARATPSMSAMRPCTCIADALQEWAGIEHVAARCDLFAEIVQHWLDRRGTAS